MPAAASPYWNRTIAFATMHQKQRAVAKPFGRWLGSSVVVPNGIDTDRFGTFTGEVPRGGTMLDAARAKAKAAMAATGLPFGLGSEGSFGPDPAVPFVPRGIELLLFIDGQREFEVVEILQARRTNYQHRDYHSGDDIGAFLRNVDFPRHAIVVTLDPPCDAFSPIKGILTWVALETALTAAADRAAGRRIQIATDMRAHVNPTRMAAIRAASTRLARRLATLCLACGTPGFGVVGVKRGAPCAWCYAPTDVAVAEVRGCAKCDFKTTTRLKRAPDYVDPGSCRHCNP